MLPADIVPPYLFLLTTLKKKILDPINNNIVLLTTTTNDDDYDYSCNADSLLTLESSKIGWKTRVIERYLSTCLALEIESI
jgi:hypothetical protein